jgi:hypothetical protein
MVPDFVINFLMPTYVANFTNASGNSAGVTFRASVNDTLFEIYDVSSPVVFDSLTAPSNVQPSNVSILTKAINANWSASTGGVGSVVYDVVKNVDGSNVTIATGVVANSLVFNNAVETANGYVYVRARDDYVNTSYVANALPFTVTLDPALQGSVCAALTYPNEEDLPAQAVVPVNFSVNAPLGFTAPVVNIVLSLGGNQYSDEACSYVQVDSDNRDYTCNVSMHYYTAPGSYGLNVTYTDGVKVVSVYQGGVCEYAQLIAYKRTGSSISFPSASPGVQNATGDSPIVLKNTGNANLNVSMTAYDLRGRSNPNFNLLASNFKAGLTLGGSVSLSDGVSVPLGGQIVPSLNNSYLLWLSMPLDQIVQSYYTVTPWSIVATG